MSHLTNPTDDDLNAAFAEHVANVDPALIRCVRLAGSKSRLGYRFLSSVDAVLPYLEAWRTTDANSRLFTLDRNIHGYRVFMRGDNIVSTTAYDATNLARAIVIALLRSKGHTVEFTT